MAQLKLLKKSTNFDQSSGSYRMTLEILSSEVINKNVFVLQRIRDLIKNNFEDVFVAVCTPAQLEDFDVSSPSEDTTYFRASQIDLVSRNAAYLQDAFESILVELQKLVDDYEALNDLKPDGIYTITANSINVSNTIVHEHYRLPLVARPCGDNDVYEDGGVFRHRILNQDNNLSGWIATTNADPAGYKFKYNISKDSALSLLWPPSVDKLSFAHLEVEGITKQDALITADTIYWKENLHGYAPWPIDYVSPSNTSSSGENVRLVLDFIV